MPFPLLHTYAHWSVFIHHATPAIVVCRMAITAAGLESKVKIQWSYWKSSREDGLLFSPSPWAFSLDLPTFLTLGTQKLSTMGNHILLADVQSVVCKRDPDFMLPWKFRVLQENNPNVENLTSRRSYSFVSHAVDCLSNWIFFCYPGLGIPGFHVGSCRYHRPAANGLKLNMHNVVKHCILCIICQYNSCTS